MEKENAIEIFKNSRINHEEIVDVFELTSTNQKDPKDFIVVKYQRTLNTGTLFTNLYFIENIPL